MKMFKVATMLLACTEAIQMEQEKDLDDKEQKLSQSFASAFNMEPPKLMTTDKLPQGTQKVCPEPGQMLTNDKSGGAFLDGCYMNTTRLQDRNEATGEESQHYLYMWKHACAFTRWVPSNQFMYSNLDYDANTMTLERFGFIGMDKRCFWGSIGLLWKRPLPVEQIIPNTTVEVQMPKGPQVVKEGQLVNRRSSNGLCLGVAANTILIQKCDETSDIWQHFDNGVMKNKATGLCMSTPDSKHGTPIVQADCNGSAKQQWRSKVSTNPWFQLESYQYDNVCVDIGGSKAEKGQKIQMYKCLLGNDNFEYKWRE